MTGSLRGGGKRSVIIIVMACAVLIWYGYPNNFSGMMYSRLPNTAEGMPGAYLKHVSPSTNESYCKLNYKLPERFDFYEKDLLGTPEYGTNSQFRVLYNVLEASGAQPLVPVTYATHLTVDFLNYISELVRYWDGLVSVAVHVYDNELQFILQQLLQHCYCIPAMSRVSLHIVIRRNFDFEDSIQLVVPPLSCDIGNASVQSNKTLSDWYPVNVCRNVARTAALTEYVLVSDIELMPSKDLAKGFLKMLQTFRCVSCPRRVFVVPIFEIGAAEPIPRTKKELRYLVLSEKASYFHRHICTHCQKFPGLEVWFDSDPSDTVQPFIITKRQLPYHRWEPIYIGTKDEPLYNEALSWEGFQDKMLQMLEMCLMGYKFVVLDGAFLVHWPGIKQKSKEPWRRGFVKMNQRQYDLILRNISSKHLPNPRCRPK